MGARSVTIVKVSGGLVPLAATHDCPGDGPCPVVSNAKTLTRVLPVGKGARGVFFFDPL